MLRWVTPVYRHDEEGGPDDLPPPLPDGVGRDGVQWYTDGYGAVLHRRYAVRVADPRVGPDHSTRRVDDPPAVTDASRGVSAAGRG